MVKTKEIVMRKYLVLTLIGAGIIIFMASCKGESGSNSASDVSVSPPFSEEEVKQ